MTTVSSVPASLPVLNSALTWLNAPRMRDPLHDLAPLRHHLRGIADSAMAPLERIRILGLFQAQADAINGSLKTLLHQSTLPLTHRLRLIAQGLTDIHGLLATTTLNTARKLTADDLAEAGQSLAALCDGMLNNLAEQQQVALLVAAAPPPDLWRHTHIVYSLLKKCLPDEVTPAEQEFKRMLALAAAQPESFTSHEIAFLIDYLRCIPIDVELDRQKPLEPLDAWHWLDENRGLPPVAVARRPPGTSGKTLYFSCAGLAQLTNEHLRRLATGENAESLGLPASADTDDYRIVLARTTERWSSPPRRTHHHRPSNYSVEICLALDQLWDVLRGAECGDIDRGPSSITKWMVLNESPGGLAMMHLSGAISGLVSGGALGLRTSPERPWNICLVRWTRSNNPEHIEIGLELIAPSAAPVQIVRRDNCAVSRLAPALLLRPAHGHHHHHHETMLTSRSGTTARPFTMIAEPDGKLQLTECQVNRLALQTSSVEMFEFSRNFSPS